MHIWQTMVSICAGVITLITVMEKMGVIGGIKKIEHEFNELKKLNVHMEDINKNQSEFGELQKSQNTALLAILRNDLYQSFRMHRHHEMWTDDECAVQTKLHAAYEALNGNGEEKIWWEKKVTWNIVSEEEYRKIVQEECDKNK